MSRIPTAIVVRCDLAADTAATAALLLCSSNNAPSCGRWTLRQPDGSDIAGDGLEELLACRGGSILHATTDTGVLHIQPARCVPRSPPRWACTLRAASAASAVSGAAIPVAQALTMGGRLIGRLAASGRLYAAALQREAGTPLCLPFPPHAGQNHLIAVPEAAWANDYAEAEAARAAWPQRERIGELHVLGRAEGVVDGADFLTAIHDGQWAMVRAARPGLTQYPPPEPTAEDEAFLRRAPATLHATGHLAAGDLIEFTCALPPNVHISAWDIWHLRQLLADGRLDDGRRVASIRVLFLDVATAERERRPLLDLGVVVQAYDNAGSLVTIAP